MINFAKADLMVEANHGLRKDFESKVALFPFFDSVALATSAAQDMILGREHDTLEDCMMELEELKDELSTIIHDQTTGGRDRWDTPEIKLPGNKKGRLRKDRYSALLIANQVARVMNNESMRNEYQPVGGFAGQKKPVDNTQMYVGPERYIQQMSGVYGRGVFRT